MLTIVANNKDMRGNKHIERDGQQVTKIFDNRTLEVDYRNLKPILKKGMLVLDVGCGTGAISKDIAKAIGQNGKVIGIDNTEKFIESGKVTYSEVKNLELIHVDLFDFEPKQKFDLIVSARVLQWLINPQEALMKMKKLLKSKGKVSILDYNHKKLQWDPSPPESMISFYQTFLKWRQDAGMDNEIADHLSSMLQQVGFHSIETINSNEHYERKKEDFLAKVGIWSKVAGSSQMVEEGYLDNDLRLKAIEEYDYWVKADAISMTMKLNEVRAIK